MARPRWRRPPTAVTSFGGGTASQVFRNAKFHVARDRPGDEQTIRVARRGNELDAKTPEFPADVVPSMLVSASQAWRQQDLLRFSESCQQQN